MYRLLNGRAMRRLRTKQPPSPQPVLLVLGNGIASVRFCEEAVKAGLTASFRIVVLGGESRPAYDRVRLSRYIETGDAAALVFRDAAWYAKHDIDLHPGDPAVSLDLGSREVVTAAGARHHYDELVFATGSSAFVPPIPGADGPRVFVYRTLDDLDAIRAASAGKSRAAVIGGGLLGLEAAQALKFLGLRVTVVERAAFPMPRQLNAAAGEMLQHEIGKLQIGFHGNAATQAIEDSGGELVIRMDDGSAVRCDLVVVSAGISPNSRLAQAAGIACGVRGGIVVDDRLSTSEPHVHAIGECALHRGEIYGLAAPAAAMARHLVSRLAGRRCKPFTPPDLSTRLKLLGIEVASIGAPLDRGQAVEFRAPGRYRLLVAGPDRRIRGALGIGPWPESTQVHQWFLEGRRLPRGAWRRFEREGLVFPERDESDPAAWPDGRLVCNCMHVTKGELCAAMARCEATPEALARETGASTVCGTCKPLLARLCGLSAANVRPAGAAALLWLSLLALPVALVAAIYKFPVADSVASIGHKLDKLWSEPLPKQVTGYALLAVSLLGLLVSLRKRWSRFRFGAFGWWRVFHAAFGLVALAVLFAHTGFRFGANLNAWLMAVFVGLSLLGAATGIAASLESQAGRAGGIARRFRPPLLVAHYVLFWPLPVLVAWHIAAAYLY